MEQQVENDNLSSEGVMTSSPSEQPEKKKLNPWKSIWFHPRATIQQIVDTDRKKYVLWLALLGGIINKLWTSLNSWAGGSGSLTDVVAESVILGGGCPVSFRFILEAQSLNGQGAGLAAKQEWIKYVVPAPGLLSCRWLFF